MVIDALLNENSHTLVSCNGQNVRFGKLGEQNQSLQCSVAVWSMICDASGRVVWAVDENCASSECDRMWKDNWNCQMCSRTPLRKLLLLYSVRCHTHCKHLTDMQPHGALYSLLHRRISCQTFKSKFPKYLLKYQHRHCFFLCLAWPKTTRPTFRFPSWQISLLLVIGVKVLPVETAAVKRRRAFQQIGPLPSWQYFSEPLSADFKAKQNIPTL